MTYIDEEIVQLKKEARNQQFSDIETTGIYIQDNLTLFQKQYFFDGTLCVLLPEEFIDMPDPVKQLKYPSVDRPQVIKTSMDTTVNFSFSKIGQQVDHDRVEELAEQLKQVLKTANPKIKYEEEEAEDTPTGNRISLFEFVTNGIDDRMYNLFCVMNVNGGVIRGSFNCLDKDSVKWKEAAWAVFTRMEEIPK